jgi:phosphate acyltransferase
LFVGNLEGRDVYAGEADVVVCDGFTGNVTLKISEGLVETVERMLHDELSATFGTRMGYLLSRQAYRRFRKRLDASEYGGAPLVGLNGLCVIGHGRSSAKAVRNGVAMAARFVEEGLLEKLTREVMAGCIRPGSSRWRLRPGSSKRRTGIKWMAGSSGRPCRNRACAEGRLPRMFQR